MCSKGGVKEKEEMKKKRPMLAAPLYLLLVSLSVLVGRVGLDLHGLPCLPCLPFLPHLPDFTFYFVVVVTFFPSFSRR